MIRFVGGLALALASLVGAYVLEGGAPLTLLGLSALLITFFMPFFGVLAVWTFSEFACYLSGLVAFLIGLVLILGNLNVPQEQIARAFGAGLVAPIYGLVFGFTCRILRARVERVNA